MLNNASRFVSAAIPQPFQILGLRLKPFCLGHVLLFKRFGCAFGDEESTPANPKELVEHFLAAVVICSMTYGECLDAMTNDKLTITHKGKSKVISFRAWLTDWDKQVQRQAKHKDFDVFERLSLFRDYTKIDVPKYFNGDASEDAKESGAHWTQSVLMVLTSELNYSQDEALNMPISKALADYFRWAEKQGVVQLMTDEELEQIEEVPDGTR